VGSRAQPRVLLGQRRSSILAAALPGWQSHQIATGSIGLESETLHPYQDSGTRKMLHA